MWGNMAMDGAIYNIGGRRWQYHADKDQRWVSTLGCERGSYNDVANTVNVYKGYPPDFVELLAAEVAPVAPTPVVAPEPVTATTKQEQKNEQKTKGQSDVRVVSTPENKTGGKQTEQSVAPVSTTVGDGNATTTISPTLTSSQDLASQASNAVTVSPVVTTSNSMQTSSAQTTSLAAQGATLEVSPVLNVQMGDTYQVSADSNSAVTPQPISWTTVLAAGAVGIVALIVWKRKGKVKTKGGRK